MMVPTALFISIIKKSLSENYDYRSSLLPFAFLLFTLKIFTLKISLCIACPHDCFDIAADVKIAFNLDAQRVASVKEIFQN